MNASSVGLAFIVFLVVLFFFIRHRRGIYREECNTVYRYKLYAIRDKIVRLVAENKIDENNLAFQFIYQNVNQLTPVARPLKLREFVSMINASSITNWEELERIREAFVRSHPDVQHATVELFTTLLDLLVFKSVLVRLAVQIGMTGYKITRALHLRRVLAPVFRQQNQAYELYRELEQRSNYLCPAV